MLKKWIYSCKYMDSWKRFNEKSSPDKEDFYKHLNIEKIINADYKHAKKVWKNFEMKNFGYYNWLHVQCDTLLHIHVFESFCNRCICNRWAWSSSLFITYRISMASVILICYQWYRKKLEVEYALQYIDIQ